MKDFIDSMIDYCYHKYYTTSRMPYLHSGAETGAPASSAIVAIAAAVATAASAVTAAEATAADVVVATGLNLPDETLRSQEDNIR